jgi:hypothetical protein
VFAYPLRQHDDECGTRARHGLQRNVTSMRHHQPTRYGKAETGASLLTRAAVVDLLKILKDACLVGKWNARPGVLYGNPEMIVDPFDPNLNPSYVSELDRVTYQIQEHLR